MAPVFTGNWFNFGRNPGGGPAGPAYIEATGGTTATYPSGGNTWKVHKYTSPGPNPFVIQSAGTDGTYGGKVHVFLVGGLSLIHI